MPPISILDYEYDDDGGWLVHWRDEANVDGEPVEAFIHLTPEKVSELAVARKQVKAPQTEMAQVALDLVQAREEARGGNHPSTPGPNDPPPDIVRRFINGYETHVQDCIDRINLNVKGGAPYEILEQARQGGQVDSHWRRNDNKDKLNNFIEKRRNTSDG